VLRLLFIHFTLLGCRWGLMTLARTGTNECKRRQE
jgi:hypothetical protein